MAPVATLAAAGAASATWAGLGAAGGGFSSLWPLRLASAPVRGAPALGGVEELRPVPRDLRTSLSEIPCCRSSLARSSSSQRHPFA